jgi:hypothetical protein
VIGKRQETVELSGNKEANEEKSARKNQKPPTVIFTWSAVHRFDFSRISLIHFFSIPQNYSNAACDGIEHPKKTLCHLSTTFPVPQPNNLVVLNLQPTLTQLTSLIYSLSIE